MVKQCKEFGRLEGITLLPVKSIFLTFLKVFPTYASNLDL